MNLHHHTSPRPARATQKTATDNTHKAYDVHLHPSLEMFAPLLFCMYVCAMGTSNPRFGHARYSSCLGVDCTSCQTSLPPPPFFPSWG